MTTQQIEQGLLVLPTNERLHLARLSLDSVLSDNNATMKNGPSDQAIADDRTSLDAQFEQEVEAFERLLPTLRQQYEGAYVEVHQGQVIAHGQDKLELLRHVRQEHGRIVCYIEQVAADLPRKARIISTRSTTI